MNDVIEGIDDHGKAKIVMFVSALGQTSVGEYRNEYVWSMGFDGSGERISEWTEFVDVGMLRDFYPKLAEALKKKAEEAK